MATSDAASVKATCRCGTELWAERAGEWTLAQRIVKLGPGGFSAKCPKCRADVPIPWLRIEVPSDPPRPRRRMVVKRPT